MTSGPAEQLTALLSALDNLPPCRGPSCRGYAVPDGRPSSPAPSLEELKDQMRAAIREARGRDAVAVVTPGRFAGPLT